MTRMIDKIIRAMQDTGLIDGMSVEDCDTLATAALEAMREPTTAMCLVDGPGDAYGYRDAEYSCVWHKMIDAALNE